MMETFYLVVLLGYLHLHAIHVMEEVWDGCLGGKKWGRE